MLIKVRTLTGKTLDLEVEPNDTILRIKELLEQNPAIGVAPQHQRLIFEGRELLDERHLDDGPRPITEGMVLHLVMRTANSNVAMQAPVVQQNQMFVPPGELFGGYNPYNPYALPPAGMAGEPHVQAVVLAPNQVFMQNDLNFALLRTNASNRVFGFVSIVAGILIFVDGLYSLGWASILIGILCAMLGSYAVKAANSRDTFHARRYYHALVAFVLITIVILIIDLNTTRGSYSTSSVFTAVVVAVFFPLLACCVCMYMAKRQYALCLLRDGVVGPPPGVPAAQYQHMAAVNFFPAQPAVYEVEMLPHNNGQAAAASPVPAQAARDLEGGNAAEPVPAR